MLRNGSIMPRPNFFSALVKAFDRLANKSKPHIQPAPTQTPLHATQTARPTPTAQPEPHQSTFNDYKAQQDAAIEKALYGGKPAAKAKPVSDEGIGENELSPQAGYDDYTERQDAILRTLAARNQEQTKKAAQTLEDQRQNAINAALTRGTSDRPLQTRIRRDHGMDMDH